MGFVLPAPTDMTPEQRAFYDGFPLNLSRGLVLTKSSAAPYLSFGLSFQDGWLPPDVRELIILRVGALTAARYEVFHHRPIALAVGAAEDTVDRVLAGSTSVGTASWDALMRFVDDVVGGVSGPAPDTTEISSHYSDEQVAEIVLLVGHYVMTALFIKTLGIEPETPTSMKGTAAHGN